MHETRILLVDDHAVLRAGLRLLLDAEADLSVVGEAGDGQKALALAGRLTPDLILLDLTMPGMGGLAAIPALRKAAPAAKILILTMHDDESYLRQALRDLLQRRAALPCRRHSDLHLRADPKHLRADTQ